MCKRNNSGLASMAFCFAVLLSVSFWGCSLSHASVIYWGLPAMYSHAPGNFTTGALSNMTARSYGAYAFTDYANSWGLNNPIGPAAGMGLAGLNTWGKMYSLTPAYGYNTAVFTNPWANFSLYPTSNQGYTLPNYGLFTPPSLPLNTYSPYNSGITTAPWTTTTPWTSSIPLLSIPATTTATPTTTTTTTP